MQDGENAYVVSFIASPEQFFANLPRLFPACPTLRKLV